MNDGDSTYFDKGAVMGSIDFADLMDFLEARIAEDEETAKALKSTKSENTARLRDRVLADVEAKRRLMGWVEEVAQRVEVGQVEADGSRGRAIFQRIAGELYVQYRVSLRSQVIFELVAAYADHPDFESEWKQLVAEPAGETATADGA